MAVACRKKPNFGESVEAKLVEVKWVKAHQSVKNVKAKGDPEKLKESLANDAADKAADEGRELHAQMDQEKAKEV